ncbi:ester cyclase [Microbispora sp. NPDC049125]|uniref:ester cyclase n=1 Tax=Microbispora sp. NPDC049125 TaxID=3154929 RepID=UPI003466A05D
MSEESTNTEVLRRFVDAFNNRDAGAYDALLAADVVDHHLPPGMPAGRDGITTFVSGLWTTFDAGITVDELVASGDVIACRWTFAGTQIGEFAGIAASGRRFSVPIMTFDRFADGRIVERWEAFDSAELLRQLSPVPAV